MTFEPGPTNPQPLSAGPHMLPSFDPLEFLPPAAAERLRSLRQRAADLHAVIPMFESVRSASLTKIEAANALKRLTDHPQDFGRNLPETDPLVVAAHKHLDKMTADFKRLTELQEVRTAAWQSASGALAACDDLLRHGVPGNCQIDPAEVEPPKLNKGETDIDAIERYRRRGRELKADLHRIRSAPFPSSYSKQRLREMVEQLAARGTPDVTNLIEHDRNIIWPTLRVQSEVHGAQRSLAFHEAIDVVGLLALLVPSALIAVLDAQIDAEKDDPAALSHEAREKAEAEVQGDLLAVERDECALVWSAQQSLLPCEHRADINPVALLGLSLTTAPRTAASPDTTPGYSWPWRR